MIRHAGSLRSFRLALALLLAVPWGDALASAGDRQPAASASKSGDGWRREPAQGRPQVLSSRSGDFDEADDDPATQPAPGLAGWSGFRCSRVAASAEAIGPGRAPSGPSRFLSLCRFRC